MDPGGPYGRRSCPEVWRLPSKQSETDQSARDYFCPSDCPAPELLATVVLAGTARPRTVLWSAHHAKGYGDIRLRLARRMFQKSGRERERLAPETSDLHEDRSEQPGA